MQDKMQTEPMNANVDARTALVNMGMIYHFFVNTMQVGAAARLTGVNVGVNAGAAAPEVVARHKFAASSRNYTSPGGKPFMSIENPVEVDDWLIYCEKIFVDLSLTNEQNWTLASRQLQGANLY